METSLCPRYWIDDPLPFKIIYTNYTVIINTIVAGYYYMGFYLVRGMFGVTNFFLLIFISTANNDIACKAICGCREGR